MENLNTIINDKNLENIDWSKIWSDKYPIINNYHDIAGISKYKQKVNNLYNEFNSEYGMSQEDTMLILKDILYLEYLNHKK